MKKSDLEQHLRDAILHGADLPRKFDLVAELETLNDVHFAKLGRIAARALLEKSLSRLLMRRTVLFASLKKPPVH